MLAQVILDREWQLLKILEATDGGGRDTALLTALLEKRHALVGPRYGRLQPLELEGSQLRRRQVVRGAAGIEGRGLVRGCRWVRHHFPLDG